MKKTTKRILGFLLVLCMVLSNIFMIPAKAADIKKGWERVSAYHESVKYTGNWTRTNENNTDFAYSSDKGATVSFTFTGTGIRWIGQKDTNFGMAEVTLDGESTDVDVNGSFVWGIVLFEKTELEDKEHTITIKVKAEDEEDNVVDIHYFDYMPSGAECEPETFESNLPVIYIDTEDGQGITSKDDYKDATMSIEGNDIYNEDTCTLYEGKIEIKGRGHSTWNQPKKPYRIKLDKKTDVFGLGKNKNWVLLANYLDETLMRNTLAYDLSGAMGMNQMSTVWVDVVLNGEYIGNYQFCEQVRVDESRVDIFDWEGLAEDAAEIIADAEGLGKDAAGDLEDFMKEKDLSWITSGVVNFGSESYKISDYPEIEVPSINGGYLLELDAYFDEVSKFRTDTNQPIMFKSPEFAATNKDMMEYVQTYVQAFEDAIHASDYMAKYEGKDTHYTEFMDFESLVDYWLVTEIFFNCEIGNKSTYMYKDIDDSMVMGPIWDMDWSAAGMGDVDHTDIWGTYYFDGGEQIDHWYRYIAQDLYFVIKAQERYLEIRDKEVADMVDAIDDHYEYLKDSAAANGDLWGYSKDYKYYVDELKNWMIEHLDWMDEQMADDQKLATGLRYKASDRLALTVTDANGKALAIDEAAVAKADAAVITDQKLVLSVGSELAGTAKVYVNSKELAGSVSTGSGAVEVEISAGALTAAPGEKNVIEVKIYDKNGIVISRNFVTVREVACEHAETTEVCKIFTDVVHGAWYEDSVQYVYDKGLLLGDGETFAPNSDTTRAMVAEVLYRFAGSPGVTDYAKYDQYTDLEAGAWYANAAAWALNTGIATGDDYNMFYNPNVSVTREQLAVFLWRYAKLSGEDVTVTSTEEELFGETYVNEWAKEGFAWAVERGIIKGAETADAAGNISYNLNPQGGATRAQFARMLHRYLEGVTE